MRAVTTIIISFLASTTAFSQDFVAQSALPPVPRDGFYKIPLSPDLSSCVNTSLSNLRIVDANGIQIPFVVKVEKEVAGATEFVPYDVEESEILKDSCTILILKNNSDTIINNINLVIRNAAVSKEAALYGSDDRKSWYALKDKFMLRAIGNAGGTAEVRIIDFPASNYTYYKIWINDKHNAPLNILQAGYYKNIAEKIRYEEISPGKVTQENDLKTKKSYLRISLDTVQLIDRISWNISGMPFYQRTASLYTVRKRQDKRGTEKTYSDYIGRFEINSRHESIQYLPDTKTDNLVLEISNGDNPPLKIEDIRLYQVKRYVVAWLNKSKSYALRFGGEEMAAADYDLELFKDSIPVALAVVEPGKVHLIKPATAKEENTIFTSRLFIWIALVVVMVALGIMSVRMIRETKAVEE